MLTFEEFLIEQQLDADEARTVLGLPVAFSPEELVAAYRKAAKQNHPDVGGSHVAMMRINAAYSKLKSLSPNPVVAPSTATADLTSFTNSEDEQYKRMRAQRRAELKARADALKNK